MLKLKETKFTEHTIIFKYEVEHSSSGRDGTTLTQDLRIEAQDPNFYAKSKVMCSMNIVECEADTVDESLDKMAEWLERLAKGLKERKQTYSVFT